MAGGKPIINDDKMLSKFAALKPTVKDLGIFSQVLAWEKQ